jgi:hypothetical protein
VPDKSGNYKNLRVKASKIPKIEAKTKIKQPPYSLLSFKASNGDDLILRS